MTRSPLQLPRCDNDDTSGIRAPDRSSDGWCFRYVADPARAEEARDLYQSMGYEVRLDPATPELFGPSCGGCATNCSTKVLIYTRQREGGECDDR